MAGEFLKSHGIDIDAEMARIQGEGNNAASDPSAATTQNTRHRITNDQDQNKFGPTQHIINVSLPGTDSGTRWDIVHTENKISRISPHSNTAPAPHNEKEDTINGHGALLAPSLCHPHIHLDKAYLLSHPKHSHLQISRGDFAEAMELTSTAKAQFTPEDLLERGQRLIDESVAAGVTHMRAFVEVDAGVGMKCLEAGVELKRKAEREGRCHVQLCAFAQLPLFTASKGDEDGSVIRGLMEEAAGMEEVDVVGSTPYVESDRGKMERNVRWMVELSLKFKKHLDFHLDYNLDPATEPMVWHVIRRLKEFDWKACGKTVVLGHCTRLTLFSDDEWQKLKKEVAGLPISFVGLPTSDLFMMRTPERTRGTMDVPRLIKDYGINACLGINNIGNAFTPHGSCDPLTLACNGVGVYSAGTQKDAELLYECVSTRARAAIGVGRPKAEDVGLEIEEGDECVLLFGADEREDWRTRKTIAEAVYLYDSGRDRRVIGAPR